jgi:type I restriction-modification system DNA methylase subunit
MQLNNLISLFTKYADTQDYSTAFSQLLDYMLTPFKWHEHDRRQALASLLAHKKRELLLPIITEIGQLSEGFADPLGSLYEQLISKGRLGQYFFTPPHVSDFMAALTIGDSAIPGKTVFDPACGSGRMLLSAAKINRHLRLYGADIDLVLCRVTLANMLLNSLTGEIAHMNTLTNEFYIGYKTDTILRAGYHIPYYREFAVREESVIWRQGNIKSN